MKHNYIRPLRIAGFHLKYLQKDGFKISKNLSRSCLNPNYRHPGGRKPLSNSIINSLNNYLEANSEEASNRVVMVCNFIEIFIKDKDQHTINLEKIKIF